METFIAKVTDYILEHHQHDFKQLTIVFPNRRAGIYLKKELASKAGKTIWLPKILSIEEAFVEWSGIDLADPLSIVFELLEIYLNNNPDKANDLNIFIGYAQQMAREFDEIDHYLVDTDILFNYLSEAKAIELWHADGSPLTVYEQNYLAFFKSLNSFYKSLKHRLNLKKMGYQGSIAAHLADLKNDDLLSILGNTKVIFAGFNALTPAEEKVISSLANEGKATVLWDLDSYYINENKFGWHEAGSSIRKFGKNHPKLLKNWIDPNLLEGEKKINLIGVPGNIGQAKAAGYYLQMTAAQTSTLNGTAVVLADEKLLSPVLNSIPDDLGKFNVTMGLPFIYSPVYQFIISLFELTLQRFQNNEGTLVPLKPLIGLLQHELISQFVSKEDNKQFNSLVKSILNDGSGLVKIERINELTSTFSQEANEIINLIIGDKENAAHTMLQDIQALMAIFHNSADATENKAILIKNQVNVSNRLINRLLKLIEEKSHLIDVKGLQRLFFHIAPSYSISIYGEPLEGLQVMGMLETRNLDFNCVHLLSANEGILPAEKGYQSIIPFDIRKTFGIPTYIEKQAVYAFHFFRMIQKSKEVYIYYNTEPDELGGGEMSRFVMQLKFELSQLNPKIVINETLFSFDIPVLIPSNGINIQKTADVIKRIQQKAEKGLSPSSLSRYISCPLQFYLQDVLGIRENPDPTEALGLNILGTVVHQTLENSYKDWIGAALQPDVIKLIQNKISNNLMAAFKREFPGGSMHEGRNKLSYVVAEQFVKQFFLYEFSVVSEPSNKLVIEALEAPLHCNMEVDGINLLLKGNVDRIDQLNGKTRIIDYKTGTLSTKELEVKDWDDLLISKKAKALQLAIYQFLYMKNNPIAEFPVAGIFSLRSLSKGLIETSFPETTDLKQNIDEIESIITQILKSIFDSNTPFSQTENTDACKICAFNQLCQRN